MFKTGEAGISLVYIFLPLVLGLVHGRIKANHPFQYFLPYYLFISVGIQGLVTAFVQIVKPEIVVEYVQWPYSRFLLELGMANAAFGVIGILSVWMDNGWKFATATGYGLFLLFTGVGHLVHIQQQGINPGDAAGFLFSDLLVPLILFTLVARRTV